jgi:hypothetical protein
MASKLELVGLRIGRLTVEERVGTHKTPKGVQRSLWRCRCDCGGETTITAKVIRSGHSQSCGCLQKERVSEANRTHQGSRTKLYKVWTAMKQRCHNPDDPGYHNYGGRGIEVCERWRESFEAFLADVGPKPSDKHSLDRFPNGNGNYEPGNVRWATWTEQMSNTRRTRHIEYGGETLTIKEWSVRTGIAYATLKQRLDNGMSPEAALTTPVLLKYSKTHHKLLAMSPADSL